MKKITFLILATTILLFTSCSSDNNSSNDSDELFIRFKANDQDFNYSDPATASSQNLTINGSDNNNSNFSSISIWFPLTISTGTFSFTGDGLSDGDYKLNFDSTTLSVDGWSDVGSVTITSITSEFIEGTFTGTIDGVNITEGEFRAFNL